MEIPEKGVPLEIGKGRIVREGKTIAILSLGTRLAEATAAADELASKGWSTTVADARFAKPLDEDLIRRLAAEHEVMITIEEGSAGGFGAHVMQFLANNGLFDDGLKFRTMVLPDNFIDQDKPDAQYELAGLKRRDMVATALLALGEEAAAATVLRPQRA